MKVFKALIEFSGIIFLILLGVAAYGIAKMSNFKWSDWNRDDVSRK